MKLFSMHLYGNIHMAIAEINRSWPEMVPCIIHIDSLVPMSTIVVYRAERDLTVSKNKRVPDL